MADRLPLPRARHPALRRRPAAPARRTAAGGPGRAARRRGGASMRAQRERPGRVLSEMRALGVTLAVALSVCGLALAQEGEDTVSDGDDSRSRVDIASARAVHDASNDRLAHIVRFHEPISPRDFRNAVAEHGPPGSVCVDIWTTRTPREESPNFDACVSSDRDRDELLAS